MEILNDKIEAFLFVDESQKHESAFGNGYGFSNGRWFGCGLGDGNSFANGYGYGDEYGNGKGKGYGHAFGAGGLFGKGNGSGFKFEDWDREKRGRGDGTGISEYNGNKVYKIDRIPTIIENVKGNIAKGYTLKHNVILVPCYIAKVGNFFAHGKTAHEALVDATMKYGENNPLEERIAAAIKMYPTLDTVVSHQELYILHHVLTGSCKFGRDEFAKAHNLDPNNGEMTMCEFIELTKLAYGGDVIKQLKKAYCQ